MSDTMSDTLTITAEAESLVMGDRGDAYGHPLDDYTRTAELWSALLSSKLKEPITAQDAIRCMCAVKLSRDSNRAKRDNRVDLAGYALCLQLADDEEQRREDIHTEIRKEM